MRAASFPLPLIVLCLCAVTAHAAGTNVLLAQGRTEPTVAVDPRDPGTLLVGSNTNYSIHPPNAFPVAYFTSHDGGRSFVFRNMPVLSPYTTGADPSVAITGSGTVFYSYLGETPAYCSSGHSAVLVTHSNDRGRSFSAARVVDTAPADDKPFLVAESIPGGRAHLFETWTRWHSAGSDVWYARSQDGGATFGPPKLLITSPLDNFASVPLVGSNGHVFVFWSSFPEAGLTHLEPIRILMRASLDDGQHFGPVKTLTSFQGLPQMIEPGSLRALTAATVAADGNGYLYAAWAAVTHRYANGSNDVDIHLSRSTNNGVTWSKPVAVNDVHRGDRFMPTMSLLGDGSLGLAYYDRRNGANRLDLYAVRVKVGAGLTPGRNVRVNARTSPVSDIYYIAPGSTCFSPGRFFGDYIGSAPAPGNDLFVTWADTQLQIPQQTDLWFATVQLPAD